MGFGRSLFLAATALAIGLSVPAPARAQDGPFRTYVQGRWGQIHVRVDGPQDGLVVVLVHKMVWSSVEFSKAQPVLARRGIRSIAIDLPGYGLSDSPDTQPTADEYADALLPVLDALKVQKAVVVGANTGATLVTAFAIRHPDRTRAMVMDGPPIFEGKALEALLDEHEFDRTPKPEAATLLGRWQEVEGLGVKGALTPEAMHTGLLQFFQAGPHYLYGHQAIFRYPLKAMLDKVTVPVMLLTYPGDQLRQVSLATKAAHPDYTLKEIGWTGMTADYQAPEPWANAVADYVLALK